MRVHVDCAVATVVESTPEERIWLRSYLSWSDPQARFHNGNPVVELFNDFDNTFPAGFAGKVRKAAATRTHLSGRLDPIDVQLVDVRKPPAPRQDVDLSFLRDYQQAAVEAALTRTRGIVQISTGGGKTECMAGLVACVPERWLIIVPQADLLQQTAERIERRTGEVAGIIGDGQWSPSRVTVATFQTLSRRMSKARDKRAYDFMASIRGVIVDECHSAASGTLSFTLSKAINAYYRIGFSATPLDRSDKKALFVIAQLGGVIHRTTSAELRAMGMLADAEITMVRVEQGSTAPTWQGVYGECIVKSKARNAVVVEMAKQCRKPALVFVSQVRQGVALLPMVRKAGLRAELVWGEDDTEARRKALADLVAGRLDVIVCSSVFQQAIDIPTLEAVVNAAGGASVIQALQKIGRGTRVTADKKTFQVFDVYDDGNKWLAKHSRTRCDVYEREGYQVRTIEAADLGVTVADPRRDEHGFIVGSKAQADHRQAQRGAALRDLAGIDKIRVGKRGKILRPHNLIGYECETCGASIGNLAVECPGYRPEEA